MGQFASRYNWCRQGNHFILLCSNSLPTSSQISSNWPTLWLRIQTKFPPYFCKTSSRLKHSRDAVVAPTYANETFIAHIAFQYGKTFFNCLSCLSFVWRDIHSAVSSNIIFRIFYILGAYIQVHRELSQLMTAE